jgi:hypothetical protein
MIKINIDLVKIMEDNKSTLQEKTFEERQKEKQKQLLKKKQKQKYNKDKERYFNYYDDIKVGSHKIVDW